MTTSSNFLRRPALAPAAAVALLILGALLASTARGQLLAGPVGPVSPAVSAEPAPPAQLAGGEEEGALEIDIDAPEETVFRIGIPDLLVSPELAPSDGAVAAEIARADFRLMPGYRVIDPRSIHHDLAAEGLGVSRAEWSSLEARGVIKGQLRASLGEPGAGPVLEAELLFYALARGRGPALRVVYRGAPDSLRAWIHDFDNRILALLTGSAGPFGSRIAYARRFGPGNKEIYAAAMEGHGEQRVSHGRGVALLPAFAPQAIWYTLMTPRATYLTHGRADDRRLVPGPGTDTGAVICEGRLYFSSSRSGDAEIYSAALDGSDLRRLTRDPAIDISPACGPEGQLAFVSDREGSPQIFIMQRDGSAQRRVTFQGSYNQTPSWCSDPSNPLIAFTGRDHNLDVFTLNLRTLEVVRVTEGQGNNQSPSFSPDCRLLAFTSDRRGAPGLYLSSPNGFNQSRVLEGRIEGLRWGPAARPVTPALLELGLASADPELEQSAPAEGEPAEGLPADGAPAGGAPTEGEPEPSPTEPSPGEERPPSPRIEVVGEVALAAAAPPRPEPLLGEPGVEESAGR